MKRTTWGRIGCVLGLALACLVLVGAQPVQPAKGNGFFDVLKKGQIVQLAPVQGRVTVRTFPGLTEGWRILEIGPDWLHLESMPGALSQRRLPREAVYVIQIDKVGG